MRGLDPRIHVFGRKQDVDGTDLGLARGLHLKSATSRVNPTCGDKHGHDRTQ
jgi:hypothetical protein